MTADWLADTLRLERANQIPSLFVQAEMERDRALRELEHHRAALAAVQNLCDDADEEKVLLDTDEIRDTIKAALNARRAAA